MAHHLVLGAAGYLGRHCVQQLLEQGHAVAGVDLAPTHPDGLSAYQSLDLTAPESIAALDLDVDTCWIWAGRTGTWAGFDEPMAYVRANEGVLLNLLSALRARAQRPHLIFPSSRLVYAGRPEPLSEDAPQTALTLYAQSKRSCEAYLAMYAHAFGISYTSFRLCVPYGNMLGGSYSFGTIGALLGRARSGQDLTLYGDGSQRRTLTHVADAVSRMARAAARPEARNQTYNLGGDALSLRELAEAIAAKTGVGVSYVPWPERDRLIESDDTVFDSTRLDRLLGDSNQWRFKEWLAGEDG